MEAVSYCVRTRRREVGGSLQALAGDPASIHGRKVLPREVLNEAIASRSNGKVIRQLETCECGDVLYRTCARGQNSHPHVKPITSCQDIGWTNSLLALSITRCSRVFYHLRLPPTGVILPCILGASSMESSSLGKAMQSQSIIQTIILTVTSPINTFQHLASMTFRTAIVIDGISS